MIHLEEEMTGQCMVILWCNGE